MDYNLDPKTQKVQQLHEKKHLGHDPTTSCENVRYNRKEGFRDYIFWVYKENPQ